MKRLLLSTAALAAITLTATAPAHAVLQLAFQANAGPVVTCTDGGACDNGGQPNNILQFNQNIGQFNISGIATTAVQQNGGTNSLSLDSLIITNTGGAGTLTILAGNNGFFGPVGSINESASGTFSNNIGATATLSFFADPTNAQPTLGSLGTNLFNVSKTFTTVEDSESGTNNSPFSDPNQYSMSERAVLQFNAGASATGFAESMSAVAPAVPEPSTWAMMILGFLGIAWMGMRKRSAWRSSQFA